MNSAVVLNDSVEELVLKEGIPEESSVLYLKRIPFESEKYGGEDSTLKSGFRSVILKNNFLSRST